MQVASKNRNTTEIVLQHLDKAVSRSFGHDVVINQRIQNVGSEENGGNGNKQNQGQHNGKHRGNQPPL